MLISVDWSKIPQGQVGTANVNFVGTASGQPSETVPVTIVANHTVPASGFHGEDLDINRIIIFLICSSLTLSYRIR